MNSLIEIEVVGLQRDVVYHWQKFFIFARTVVMVSVAFCKSGSNIITGSRRIKSISKCF